MNHNTYNQKKNSLLLFTFLLLSLFLTGCSTIQVGRDFDVQLFNTKVKSGETTKTQVRSWIGAPSSTGISFDKNGELSDEWMYFYGTGALPKMDNTKLKILQIRFDKKGIINSYNWSNSQ